MLRALILLLLRFIKDIWYSAPADRTARAQKTETPDNRLVITAPGDAFSADGGQQTNQRVWGRVEVWKSRCDLLAAAFAFAAFAGKEGGGGKHAESTDNEALDALATLVAAQFVFDFLKDFYFLFFFINAHGGVFL